MKRWHWLVLAVLCSLLLCGTRYIGIAIVVGASICLSRWRDRIVVCALPVSVYIAGLVFTDWMTPHFAHHGTTLDNVLNVLTGAVAIASGMFALIVYLVVRHWKNPPIRLLGIVVGCYLLALTATVIQNRYDPTMDLRLFVPIAGPLVVLLVGGAIIYDSRLAPFLLVGLWAMSINLVYRQWPVLRDPEYKSLGCTFYQKSPAIEAVRRAPAGMTVYTDSPYLVYLHTKRVTKAVPYTPAMVDDRNTRLKSSVAEVRQTGGVMAWLGCNPSYMPPDSFFALADSGRKWPDRNGKRTVVVLWLSPRPE